MGLKQAKRPGHDGREKHCAFFLTTEDKASLDNYAECAGFRSAGQFTTAVIEQLIAGDFRPLAFFKVALLIIRHKKKPMQGRLHFGVRPPSAFPSIVLTKEDFEWGKPILEAEIKEHTKG